MRKGNLLPYDGRAAVAHLRRSDAVMGRLIDSIGPLGLEVPPRVTPFEALTRAIAHQQLNGTAANTILERFKRALGRRAFPTPDDIISADEQVFRGAGFSRAKMLAIRDLAEKTLSGVVPSAKRLRAMSEDEIIDQLTQVRGIGRWTVEMMLIFRLGRPDVLPVDDYGVRKAFTLAYRKRALIHPKALMKFGERWRPYRSVASWYLWRVLEQK